MQAHQYLALAFEFLEMSQLINNVLFSELQCTYLFQNLNLLNFQKLSAPLTYMTTYGMAASPLITFNKGDQMLCVFNGLFCIPTKCPCFGCDCRWFILKPSPAALTQSRQGTVKKQAICAKEVGWRSALSGKDCHSLVTLFSRHPIAQKSWGFNLSAFAVILCSGTHLPPYSVPSLLTQKPFSLLCYIRLCGDQTFCNR